MMNACVRFGKRGNNFLRNQSIPVFFADEYSRIIFDFRRLSLLFPAAVGDASCALVTAYSSAVFSDGNIELAAVWDVASSISVVSIKS